MFIRWGARPDARNVGPVGKRHCYSCNQETEFDGILTYKVRDLYWLFRWVSNKERALHCTGCGATFPADTDDFGKAAESSAIPFIDRMGWTIALGLIAAVIAIGIAIAVMEDRENAQLLADPQVGDIYQVDAAKMVENPERPKMYTAMRVVGVTDKEVQFQVSNVYYDKARGIDDDVRSGKAREAGYYLEEAVAIPLADLKRMSADGVIEDIER